MGICFQKMVDLRLVFPNRAVFVKLHSGKKDIFCFVEYKQDGIRVIDRSIGIFLGMQATDFLVVDFRAVCNL